MNLIQGRSCPWKKPSLLKLSCAIFSLLFYGLKWHHRRWMNKLEWEKSCKTLPYITYLASPTTGVHNSNHMRAKNFFKTILQAKFDGCIQNILYSQTYYIHYHLGLAGQIYSLGGPHVVHACPTISLVEATIPNP
jgi:hypothetical protein